MKRITDLFQYVSRGESISSEFKKSFEKEVIETLVAFANTEGGYVLIGVLDNGTVAGVTLGKETLNKWVGQIKSATSPALMPDVQLFEANDKTVVILSIDLKLLRRQCSFWYLISAYHSNLTVILSEKNGLPTLCPHCVKHC